jgi:hypothetical protein
MGDRQRLLFSVCLSDLQIQNVRLKQIDYGNQEDEGSPASSDDDVASCSSDSDNEADDQPCPSAVGRPQLEINTSF